jgi:hypothetical protein
MRIELLEAQNNQPPEGLDLFMQACSISEEQFAEYLRNSHPQKYTPFIEKIATKLYSKRILGDLG